MARFDAQKGEIVVRIVYDGLATAGKTTNLRALYEAFSHRATGGVYAPAETRTGRTLYFDWLELFVGHLDDWPLRCQILTVPGQFVYAHRRFHLLKEIDGVVLVCESTERGLASGKIALAFLHKALASSGNDAAPIVLQANKQDVAGALAPEAFAAALDFKPQAVIGAVASTGDGVRPTLLRTLDFVRADVRARLGDRAPEELPRHSESADQLYAALVDSEGSDASAALVDALDTALAEVK